VQLCLLIQACKGGLPCSHLVPHQPQTAAQQTAQVVTEGGQLHSGSAVWTVQEHAFFEILWHQPHLGDLRCGEGPVPYLYNDSRRSLQDLNKLHCNRIFTCISNLMHGVVAGTGWCFGNWCLADWLSLRRESMQVRAQEDRDYKSPVDVGGGGDGGGPLVQAEVVQVRHRATAPHHKAHRSAVGNFQYLSSGCGPVHRDFVLL